MKKEIRFILIFSTVLSLILIAPYAFVGNFSKPYYAFAIALSLILSILFVLAFSEEYKNRIAFYLLPIAVIFYLFTLPYSYIQWTAIAIGFIIMETLFMITILFFVAVNFIADIFDRDFIFLEKANEFFYSKMNSFYKLVSGGKHAEKLQTKNN